MAISPDDALNMAKRIVEYFDSPGDETRFHIAKIPGPGWGSTEMLVAISRLAIGCKGIKGAR